RAPARTVRPRLRSTTSRPTPAARGCSTWATGGGSSTGRRLLRTPASAASCDSGSPAERASPPRCSSSSRSEGARSAGAAEREQRSKLGSVRRGVRRERSGGEEQNAGDRHGGRALEVEALAVERV